MRSGLVRSIRRVAFSVRSCRLPSLAMAVDVPKWSTYDINLTASGSYSNGYTAGPSLTATFTGPGGVTKTVTGFWDGSSNFKVRFTPTVEGTWSYTTSSSDAGLNGQTGSINAVAPLAGDHGFLRIDPNYTNSFVWDDGTRNFMWGQTYYDWMQAAMVERQLEDGRRQLAGVRNQQGSHERLRQGDCVNYPTSITDYPDVHALRGHASQAPTATA